MSSQHLSPEMQAAIARGPPYPSMMATVGGIPTIIPDVPVFSVFLFLYLCSAAFNMTIFQRNRRHGKFFLPSALLFGFSMARILTSILRIVWATMPTAASTALAAQIFVNAGVLIIYILNLLFAQRILRARQPQLGWNRAFSNIFKVVYALIGCMLVLIIVFIVYGSYTLSESFHHAQLWVLRAVSLYLLLFTLLPLFVLAAAHVLPTPDRTENFGQGSMASKSIIVLTATCLSIIIAGFRMGTSWSPARPVDNPAWWDGKPAFYCFNFVVEICILVVYAAGAMDRRFHVPDGSSKRRTYVVEGGERGHEGEAEEKEEGESELEKRSSTQSSV